MKPILSAKIVRSVKVAGEKGRRPAFYTTCERPFTTRGIPCLTLSEKCIGLIVQLQAKDHREDALGHLWDCLGFVYNGEIPTGWYRGLQARPVTSVADTVVEMIRKMEQRNPNAVRQGAWDLVSMAFNGIVPKKWHREMRQSTLNPILLFT
jgi:hypothetical protein